MNDKEIRLEMLRRIIDERFGGVALRLAEALEMKPPQLHRWLSGRQGISAPSARAIEAKLDLARGWLDRLVEADPSVQATPLSPAVEPDFKAVTTQEATFFELKAAVSGVLRLMGVSFEDLVGDEASARHRIAEARGEYRVNETPAHAEVNQRSGKDRRGSETNTWRDVSVPISKPARPKKGAAPK